MMTYLHVLNNLLLSKCRCIFCSGTWLAGKVIVKKRFGIRIGKVDVCPPLVVVVKELADEHRHNEVKEQAIGLSKRKGLHAVGS